MKWFHASGLRWGRNLELVQGARLGVDARGRVAAIERAGQPLPGDRVLPGTVVPGLIDLHVHLALDGSADVVKTLDVGPDQLASRIRAASKAHIEDGVTSLRDLGSPDGIVGKLRAELPTRVAWAGAITPPGGHGHFVARQARGVRATTEAVMTAVEEGADWIKVFATGGVITSGSRPEALLATPDELGAAVRTAHSAGVRVAAHAHGAEGILAAVAAGCDTVEHVSHVDERVIAALQEGPATPISTLVATERFVRHPSIQESTPETVAKIRAHAPFEAASLRRIVQAGLVVGAGTDAGTTHNPHGGGMAMQAQLLHEAGATALDVLRTLTVRNADFVAGPVGWLNPGRFADFAAFDGDPAEDVRALARPLTVVIGGEVVSAVPPLAGP